MKLKLTLACIVVAALALVGCGSSSSSSGATTTTAATSKDAVCASKTKLTSSLEALTDPGLLTEGKSAMTKALDKVQQDLDALRTAVKGDLQPQVQDVRNAIDQLKTDIGGIQAGRLSDSIQKLGSSIGRVGSTTQTLFTSLSSRCPSS